MSPFRVIRASDIEHALAMTPRQGKNLLPPFHELGPDRPPLRIVEDVDVENAPEVHTHEGDLWLCLEGEATFICGGELVGSKDVDGFDGKEKVGSRIEGGETVVLAKGDWLWIPPGVVHQHSAVGSARLIIVKMPSVS